MLDTIAQEELISRGYSRRQLGRVVAALGAASTIPAMLTRSAPAFAQQSAKAVLDAVRIGSNECWTGPFPAGVRAGAEMMALGNRYDPDDEHGKLADVIAAVEGLPKERIIAWPGSSDPLVRSVVTFCSPTRGLVTADPTYEAAWGTAKWLEAPLKRVPSEPGKGADVKAMLAADPNAGLYYICSPNNPTGVITPIADIEWLAANKPADAVLLIDEAYIHWSESPRAARLAATRDDVIVLRTFSKLFGMAGIRLGLTFAAPALTQKMMRYDGHQVTGMLPVTAMACGRASYPLANEIKARRAEMIANREWTIAELRKRGITVYPNSEGNMFMVDWKTKPAKEMAKALLDHKVQIGRNWPIWPTVSRVTVGSRSEMQKFVAAVDAVTKG